MAGVFIWGSPRADPQMKVWLQVVYLGEDRDTSSGEGRKLVTCVHDARRRDRKSRSSGAIRALLPSASSPADQVNPSGQTSPQAEGQEDVSLLMTCGWAGQLWVE